MKTKWLSILKKIVDDHPHTEEDVVVWFSGFGDFSLNINCNYLINKKGNWAETPSQINLEILKEFGANNLDFAFPTQTVILDKWAIKKSLYGNLLRLQSLLIIQFIG